MSGALVLFLVFCVAICAGMIAAGMFKPVGLVVLTSILAFSGFGFMATFEPNPDAMYFRIAYVAAGLISATGIVLILTARSETSGNSGDH